MSKQGFVGILDAVRGLGFTGRVAPLKRKRSADFVDWLGISTASNTSRRGDLVVQVNLGVQWLPLHQAHKEATGKERKLPDVMDPLYVLMDGGSSLQWIIAADDSNVSQIEDELLTALRGPAEAYWREQSHAAVVCEALGRDQQLGRYPEALDHVLAVFLAEGRDAARAVATEQRRQVEGQTGPWVAPVLTTLSGIESYIEGSTFERQG